MLCRLHVTFSTSLCRLNLMLSLHRRIITSDKLEKQTCNSERNDIRCDFAHIPRPDIGYDSTSSSPKRMKLRDLVQVFYVTNSFSS